MQKEIATMASIPSAGQAIRKEDETFRLWSSLDPVFRWARRAVTITAVLVFGFVLLEAIRLYQTLAGIHPWIGVAALLGLGVALALVIAPAWRFIQMPRVVEPPPLPADGRLDRSQLSAEIRYLDQYLANCQTNYAFATQMMTIASARQELHVLAADARNATSQNIEPILKRLRDWSDRSMDRALADVDDRADRLIYQEALSVGLATAASPNGVLDAFVMLWRSVRLVSELGLLYYGRPGFWGVMAICRDVAAAVAVAGTMQNVSNSLGNILAGTLGKAGGLLAGPAVDGITNALVLIRIGHLAKERCRSFRRWDAATRQNAILSALSATQSVGFGLASEILRRVGSGVGALANGLASKLGEAGEQALDAAEAAAHVAGRVVGDVADNALSRAKALRDAVGQLFRGSGVP
jgi:putative membrane protein